MISCIVHLLLILEISLFGLSNPVLAATATQESSAPDQGSRIGELSARLEVADSYEAVDVLTELGKMDHPRALALLIKAAEDQCWMARISAIAGLATAGAESREAADAVARLLSDPVLMVRYNAIAYIGMMSANVDQAIQAARALLADEYLATRTVAACRIRKWRATEDSSEEPGLEEEQLGRLLRLAREFESEEEDNSREATQFLIATVMPRLPELVADVFGGHSGPGSRFVQMERLNQVGRSAELAVGILMPALDDPAPVKRREAIVTLEGIGLLAHQSVPKLRQLANTDPSLVVKAAANEALATLDDGGTYPISPIGRGFEFVKVDGASFEKPSISIDRAKQMLLDDQSDPSRASEALFAYLSDPDPSNRSDALYALRGEVTETERFAFAMRDRLLDEDYGVRLTAASALARGGNHLLPILPDLIRLVENPSLEGTIRHDLVRSLGAIGPGASGAVPALVRILEQGRDHLLRSNAAKALGKIGPGAADAVPALIRTLSLRHSKYGLRQSAAEALGKIGPGAASAVPHLSRLIGHADKSLRYNAIRALGGIGPAAESAVPQLIEALNGPDEHTASSAALALGEIGATSPAVVEALVDAINDGREVTIYALVLGKLGRPAENAIPSLARIMRGQNRNWGKAGIGRYHAIMAIGKIGGPEAVAVLESMPPTGNPGVDDAVREALVLARGR